MKNGSVSSILILSELLILLLLWLNNEFLASLVSAIIVVVSLAIWIVAVISEKIERSKVSRSFFKTILMIALIPVVLAIFFFYINGGIEWK
ncbi:MAG: hypothetical protein KDC49_17865 [Saprospiraceae bacterium]|nr:hypothetical protein [Saprospiraceae bacterium]